MIGNKLSNSILRPAWAMLFSLALFGCVLAVPYMIDGAQGENESTATLTVDQDAATLYADAVKSIKARGSSKITKEDPANYYAEGTKNGKKGSLKIEAVGPDESRMIITFQEDEDKTAIKDAVATAKEICADLGLECEEQ